MPEKRRLVTLILLGAGFLIAVVLGITLGLTLGATRNIQQTGSLQEHKPALPTQILDRNGELVTEFFSEEKRELVSIDQVPRHLIDALLTREDRDFYKHRGFRLWYIIRAALDIVTGRSFRGGSTLTQQLAGYLYADRTDISIKRKLVELWWALQLERNLTKNEILEQYLNTMYFGHNTYGVETASQFYFKHSARDLTVAESAMLVIQLASPGRYSPINHPNRAKRLQEEILAQMVSLGYTTGEEAERSFQDYWMGYDYTRSNLTSAWFEREDQAPYFSEYVRQRLEEQLLGSMDLYKEGLIVHTTLDLGLQRTADQVMEKWIQVVNNQHQTQAASRLSVADATFLPIVDLLSLSFNIEGIRFAGSKQRSRGLTQFLDSVNPVMDLSASLFGLEGVKLASQEAYAKFSLRSKKTKVEGALVAIESTTGRVLAMVGGRRFESTNQFNRAVQSKVQPGSAFKPLYYSAAISSRKLTAASMIVDAPVVFWNDDNTPYIPLNFKGEWKGRVLLRDALQHSMNVPSLRVLDTIGFDAAIERSSRMLGITDPAEIELVFPRKYPLGLGIITVSPLEMAQAFATFPNQGRAVDPVAILFVEDRNGRILLEPEKELRAAQLRAGRAQQIMPPQDAYVMTSLLQGVVSSGTLRGAAEWVGGFGRPIAGKTGTTQNWSDAWTVGFTPQVTTAIWFGFDERGYSLGINQTGATSAGPAWAEFMKSAHKDLPVAEFGRPATGLIDVGVCAKSGKLPTKYCNEGIIKEIFLSGTEPREFCDLHQFEQERNEGLKQTIKNSLLLGGDLGGGSGPPDILDMLDLDETPSSGSGNPLLD
ncbi:MAG: penicillin-binding protein [Spirochaetes bacterium RBG_16_67_19]|nr:MAG: penicillin-binding protein [Spirochaetes bacterium RBG_16_67_19]